MLKKLRRLTLILFLVFVGCTIITSLLYRFTDVIDDAILALINKLAAENVHVTYTNISGNLLGTVRLDSVEVVFDSDTLRSPRVELDYSAINLLENEYIVERLKIETPTYWKTVADSVPEDTSTLSLEAIVTQFQPDSLPRIYVGEFVVANGSVLISSGDSLQRIHDINLNLSLMVGRENVRLAANKIQAYWDAYDIKLEGASFKFSGNNKRLTLNQLEVSLPDLDLAGHGEIEFVPEPRFLFFVDTTYIAHQVVRKFAPDFPYSDGGFNFYGSFIGDPVNFKGDVYIDGKFDSLEVNHLSLNYSRENSLVQISDIDLLSNFGSITGNATISPYLQNQLYLNIVDLNLSKAGVVADTTVFSGLIEADIDSWDLATMNGFASVQLYNMQLGSSRVDAMILDLTAESGAFTLSEFSQIFVAPNAVVNISGRLDRTRNVEMKLAAESVSFDSIGARTGNPQLNGRGSLYLDMSGPIADPSLYGELELDSLTWGNVSASGVDGLLELNRVVTEREGKFDLEIATAYVGDLFLTGGLAQFTIYSDRVVLDPLEFYSEEIYVTTKSEISFADSLLHLIMDHIEFDYDGYTLKNDEPISIQLVEDTVKVHSFTLKTVDGGSLYSDGFLALNAESELSLSLDQIHLGPFNQYIYWDHELTGNVDAQLDLFGELDNPTVEALVQATDLRFDKNYLGKLATEVVFEDRIVNVNFFDYERDSLSYITLSGNVDFELSAEDEIDYAEIPLGIFLDIENIQIEDYSSFYDVNFPVGGSVNGRVELGGSMAQPEGIIYLNGADVVAAEYEFPEYRIAARVEPEQVFLDTGLVRFFNSDLLVTGSAAMNWDPESPGTIFDDQPINASVLIEDDSLDFLGALNPELDLLTGDIQIQAAVSGHYDDLQLSSANIRVRDGELYLSKLENSIQEIDADARLVGKDLVIEKLYARSARKIEPRNFLQRWMSRLSSVFIKNEERGYIRADGKINFDFLDRPKYDLAVSLDYAYVNYFLENTRLLVSSDELRITGRDTIFIEGDITVNNGEVELDLIESEKNLLLVTSTRETAPYLKYNIGVHIPNVDIRSEEPFNSFALQAVGNLRVIQEPNALLEMHGDLNIGGDYFIPPEAFTIQDGEIKFLNPKELPELNLTAEKHKNDLIFHLSVRGPLTSPEKEIRIEDQNGNIQPYTDIKDQMALLLFGVTFDELSGGAADSVLVYKGEQVLTQAAISILENQARHLTGLDRIRIDSQDSFFKSRLNTRSTLALGKYLSPKLYFEYKATLGNSGIGNIPSPELSWEAGNQVYLQYRLNRMWSFSSIFEKTEESNQRVRFDINWRVEF